MVLSGNNFVLWNQSAPPSASHLCTKLRVTCWISDHCCRLALDESQPWKLNLATLGGCLSRFCTRALPNPSLAACCLASPSSSPPEPHLNISSKSLYPLAPNPFSIIEIVHRQPCLKRLQKICNCCLPVRGSLSQLIHMDLARDNGPMLFLEEPSHPYFLPLVDYTSVRLPHLFGQLLQGEFRLLQAVWGFAFGPAQVR